MASGTRLSRQNQANGESIAENTIEFRLQDVRSPAEPALFNSTRLNIPRATLVGVRLGGGDGVPGPDVQAVGVAGQGLQLA